MFEKRHITIAYQLIKVKNTTTRIVSKEVTSTLARLSADFFACAAGNGFPRSSLDLIEAITLHYNKQIT